MECSQSGTQDHFLSPRISQLAETIHNGCFFSVSDKDILCQIRAEFPQELDRLKRAYSLRDPDDATPEEISPSRLLYGAEYDEVNRTLVGILALRWLRNGDYGAMVGTQPRLVRLRYESFAWIRDVFLREIKEPSDLYTLVTSIVVNDLGKDPQLANDYRDRTGDDISGLNHDQILLKAAKLGLVECLERLPARHKTYLYKGLELGADFNFGQLAQAENVPGCLACLLNMRGQSQAFEFRFMEQLLDVSGAAGHVDWTCAKRMTEPVFQAYHNVYDAASAIISGKLNIHDGYNLVLTRCSESLSLAGFRVLEVQKKEDRALLRLLCMGGATDRETAELYDMVWISLDKATKVSLIHTLNLEGTVTEPAVQPTYMPAMLTGGIKPSRWGAPDHRKKALQSLMRYLARVLENVEEPNKSTGVIERSVLGVLKDVVGTKDFSEDPSILETAPVPEDGIFRIQA